MQFITLGIGAQSDIAHFVLMGLSPAPLPPLLASQASVRVLPRRATTRERERSNRIRSPRVDE